MQCLDQYGFHVIHRLTLCYVSAIRVASRLTQVEPCHFNDVRAKLRIVQPKNYLCSAKWPGIHVQWIPLYWSTCVQGYFDPIKRLTQLSEVWLLCHRTFTCFCFEQSGPITQLTCLTGGSIKRNPLYTKTYFVHCYCVYHRFAFFHPRVCSGGSGGGWAKGVQLNPPLARSCTFSQMHAG